MNRRQKIIVSVTGIFLVLLILVGLTYAYFLTRIVGNTNDKSISVTTANLELVYGDGTTELLTSDTKLVPSTNPINTKDFTVTNNGDDTTYVVMIENVRAKVAGTENLTTFESNDFVYTLTCTKSDGSSCNGVSTQTKLPLSDNILVENDIVSGDTHTYEITVWYLDNGNDQSNDMNKTLEARINIEDPNRINPYSNNTDSLAYNIINNSLNVANGTSYMNTPLTTPAKASGNMVYTSYTDPTSFNNTSSYTSKWYVYGSEVTMDSDGWFKITNPQVGQFSSVATSMVNGYISSVVGYETEEEAIAEMNDEFSNVYKVGSSTTTSILYYEEVTKNNINIESVLSVTPDDYTSTTGINSYYYRGGVEDNYVNFAGMCWRIVRIEGDGSVKLILEDAYAECNDNETEATAAVYTGNWSDGNTYVFGYDSNLGADFLNYSGGLADSFKTFQTSKLSSVLDKLKIDEWCYDDTVTFTDSYGREYYGTYTRIYTDKKPSLKCTGTKLTKFKDNTNMYVATLTADEMSFAGAYTPNYNYYLMNSYSKNYLYWWSLSPFYFSEGIPGNAFYLHINGGLTDYDVFNTYSSRPAVSLKSGSVITGGDGTLEKPYIIG